MMESLSLMDFDNHKLTAEMENEDNIEIFRSRHRKSFKWNVYPIVGLVVIILLVFAIYVVIWTVKNRQEVGTAFDSPQISSFSFANCGNGSRSHQCTTG